MIQATRTPEQLRVFLNPYATANANQENTLGSPAEIRADRLMDALNLFEEDRKDIHEPARPDHIHDLPSDKLTIVYSDGGDGTIRGVVGALLGVVPNDHEATERNQARHAEALENVLYIAGAGGNGNNYSLSALGNVARDPASFVGHPRAKIGVHRPLMYHLKSERGERSGIATSCFGLGGAAIASTAFESERYNLQKMSRAARLGREILTGSRIMLSAQPFSLRSTLATEKGVTTQSDLEDITGVEFIGSRIYAKQGRSKANIDGSEIQPLISKYRKNPAARAGGLVLMLARLRTGRYEQPLLDLPLGATLTFQNMGDWPIQFHADAETDAAFDVLYPKDTLTVYRSPLAVRTAMIAPRRSRGNR